MGLRNIEDKVVREAELRRKGAQLAIESLKEMSEKLESLHQELAKFEKKHLSEIKRNPELAEQLMKVREELGLPKALGVYNTIEKPSLWKKIRGNHDYYNYLSMKIIELGQASRKRTGGLMSVTEIITELNKEAKGIVYSVDDVLKSLNSLKDKKLIKDIKTFSGLLVIEFIDLGLSEDQERILQLAVKNNGIIDVKTVIVETEWSLERISHVMDSLIKRGVVEKKETLDGIVYLFPFV